MKGGLFKRQRIGRGRQDGIVRMLFCFVSGLGHFEPTVPIARAAQDAGHTVAVACGPWRVEAVTAAGFAAMAALPGPVGAVAALERLVASTGGALGDQSEGS